MYIMKIGEGDMEYNIRILQSIIRDQATKYFKYVKKFNDESDATQSAELANKCAFNINVAGSIHKTYRQEQRIKSLEGKMSNLPINTTMFEEAPLKEYR